jgi:hypothetical protein
MLRIYRILPKRCLTIVNNSQNLAAHAASTARLDVPRNVSVAVLMHFDKPGKNILKLCSDINQIYESWNELHGKEIFDSI